jgi:hypothetical protein
VRKCSRALDMGGTLRFYLIKLDFLPSGNQLYFQNAQKQFQKLVTMEKIKLEFVMEFVMETELMLISEKLILRARQTYINMLAISCWKTI